MEYERILIVKPSSLGDIVHALPVLRALRHRFPGSHLAWFVHEQWADILRGHPDLDEVIPWSFRWSGLWDLLRIFREKRFDLAVDLQGLFRSGVISYLSGAKVRVGFESGREGSYLFYTHKVAVPLHSMHALDRYLLVAKSLGADFPEPIYSIPISQRDEDAMGGLLQEGGLSLAQPFVTINPTARWRTKQWPVERFAQLADQVHGLGMPVVLMGGRGDVSRIGKIQSLMSTAAISVAGKTSLKQLAALLKHSKLLITNDSGPMHLAAAAGTPVVALFGPTDPVRTGPYGRTGRFTVAHTVIRRPVECSPCLSRRCRVGDHRCMVGIEVQEVLESVKKMLSELPIGGNIQWPLTGSYLKS